MRQPWWKIWLSHLFEWHIESAPSPLNPHLYVSLKRGRYQLSTAHAVYSFEDLYLNFREAFRQMALERLPGREVLVLGLGLGSVPQLLEQVYHFGGSYTAVERDESVIYLAHKYTLSSLDAPMQVICADAFQWVAMQPPEPAYDLIAMDIFVDDTVPPQFESEVFLEGLRALLRPGGVLMYNRLAVTERDRAATRRFFESAFAKTFPRAVRLDLGANQMLLDSPHLLRKGAEAGR
ncbi:MAG: hypothetical protein D6818_09105 [Bacteroidetes bacterium]|nr:MAG: hypothetical protein D6818_09105 [Bacteroidota bacterium]